VTDLKRDLPQHLSSDILMLSATQVDAQDESECHTKLPLAVPTLISTPN